MVCTSPCKATMRILIFLLFPAIAAATAGAQTIKTWTPGELAKRADIICTGTLTKVEVIEVSEPGDALNYKPVAPKRVTSARIKVISTEKGVVPDEIELRYPAYDERFKFSTEEAPDHIKLEPGTSYRFYLKRVGGELWYVGALDGEANDGAAVQSTEMKEGSGALLSKKDAVDIATVYYLKCVPSASIDSKQIVAGYAPGQFPKWQVRFYSAGGTGERYDASFIVNRDQSVDEGASKFGHIGDKLGKWFEGRRVKLAVVEGKRGFDLSGVIEKMEPEAITIMDGTRKKISRADIF